MKNLCRSKGGSCNCLQKSTWGRGVQKVQKLVYVVYGSHLSANFIQSSLCKSYVSSTIKSALCKFSLDLYSAHLCSSMYLHSAISKFLWIGTFPHYARTPQYCLETRQQCFDCYDTVSEVKSLNNKNY